MAACGRIAFDPVGGAGAARDGATASHDVLFVSDGVQATSGTVFVISSPTGGGVTDLMTLDVATGSSRSSRS